MENQDLDQQRVMPSIPDENKLINLNLSHKKKKVVGRVTVLVVLTLILASVVLFSLIFPSLSLNKPLQSQLPPQLLSCNTSLSCTNMSKDCGDFPCYAQKVSCQKGICCGSDFKTVYSDTYSERKTYASSFDTEHLSECSQDISQYNDPTLCEIFPDPLKTECKNKAYSSKAYTNGEARLCENIINNTDEKDVCFSLVARKLRDPQVCAFVADELEKNICLSFVYTLRANESQDSSDCARIPIEKDEDTDFQISRNRCYSKLAEKLGNIDLCDQVSKASTRYLGITWDERSICKKWAAVEAMDVDHCQSITIPDQKWRCLWELATDRRGNKLDTYCERLTGSSYNETECRNQLVEVCHSLSKSRDRCLEEVDRSFTIYNKN